MDIKGPHSQKNARNESASRSSSRRWLWVLIAIVMFSFGVGGGWWYGHAFQDRHNSVAPKSIAVGDMPPSDTGTTVEGLKLEDSKIYGDKYADGLLPVGDGKYVTDAPKQGYVYACSQYAQIIQKEKSGASVRGPWFTNANKSYNLNLKSKVRGGIAWQSELTDTLNGTIRTIMTNDLPSHATGIFPVASGDPAYAYDRNPNSIKSQALTYALTANPKYGPAHCVGGEVGVMLTGVALFNAFDAGGRDAGAWEAQDNCGGHPQVAGEYHYHTLSSCIQDTSVRTVIGFALDGFPITGPKVGMDNVLTTSDLDECHGLISEVVLDGKKVTTYHYVMTQDFPYSVSCFRSEAIQPPVVQQPTAPVRR